MTGIRFWDTCNFCLVEGVDSTTKAHKANILTPQGQVKCGATSSSEQIFQACKGGTALDFHNHHTHNYFHVS